MNKAGAGKKSKEFYTEDAENAEYTEEERFQKEKSSSEEEAEWRRGRLSA